MKTRDVVIIGAGPAGLTAATECARTGHRTLLVDANLAPGGQLIKQTHRFFGSGAHMAGKRGIDIARELTAGAEEAGVELWLDSSVYALASDGQIMIMRGALEGAGDSRRMHSERVTTQRMILATGAEENPLAFPGWTLPGVMGAGAAQTLVNLHRVLPGRRVLMVGSGNVGLIVAYQLLQAGADVAAVVEAAPRIGGYDVHSAKLRRMGVPILTSHTIVEASGDGQVETAIIAQVDTEWHPVPGTEKRLRVDTICTAAGLKPNTRLASMAGCQLGFSLGSWSPLYNEDMQTSHPDIYVAGDAGAVEEASIAMEEGRLAGQSVAASLGSVVCETERQARRQSLASLRRGDKTGAARMQMTESDRRGRRTGDHGNLDPCHGQMYSAESGDEHAG